METLLRIKGVGFPTFSARGCQQDLALIHDPQLFRRTINGELLFLGDDGDDKYTSIITCQDKDIPAVSHLPRGAVVEVQCIQYLTQPLEQGKTQCVRQWVEGSLTCYNVKGKKIDFKVGKNCLVQSSLQEGFVRFRPLLKMRILNFRFKIDEWGAKVGWQLELEEV